MLTLNVWMRTFFSIFSARFWWCEMAWWPSVTPTCG